MMLLNRTDDKTLLIQLQNDGRNAFSEIYRKYWQELYGVAYKCIHNEVQCQDILQNIFSDLWFRRHHLKVNNLPAYLHTAVRFQVYKFVKRVSRRVTPLGELDDTIHSSMVADGNLRESEMLKIVNVWLCSLPKRRRRIFEMHYMNGIPTLEIANELGISRNTVQAQLFTAFQSLRSQILAD